MFVDHLSLANFRTYPGLDLPLAPGLTVFVGSNGVGKTNIVEAIDWAATLGSHRVSGNGPLITTGSDQAIIRVRVNRGGQRTVLEYELNAARANRVRINRAAPVRAREALGTLHTVLFSPEDLTLVKGDPSHRRRFLDDLATAMRPVLGAARSDYDRALKQRNALLKSARRSRGFSDSDRATLAVWNDQLARAGAAVMGARLQLLKALEPEVDRAYQQLTDGPKHVSLGYESSSVAPGADQEALEHFSVTDLYELMMNAFERMARHERDRGITLVGPHRDDLVIRLGDTPARGYASHGETWSTALALRLGSWYVHLADDPARGSAPVLILDDVFAELDARRRRRLAELVRQAEQVLVTAAVDEDLPAALLEDSPTVIEVEPGAVWNRAASSAEPEPESGPEPGSGGNQNAPQAEQP
ncbi:MULTISPECIES: DNA replication/repair protein RecF [unclassified Kocuria]|uniref:DNA replication/repair protein RecF n=1 Tax=unclassified Kocuria TaxID=2649579 RepID=UPI0014277E1D|nr:DNA replication/repair protein RecF [Kocuria sp. KD4]QIR68673.1 DNA replication/repair protein RecF [Kocuria sp. KD4]